MLSKNTCERVYLKVKFPAISQQVCKFTKNKLLHIYFSGFQLDFKLLFTVLFLEIMSWKGDSRSNGGRLFFRWGASSLSGGRGVPWGFSKKLQDGTGRRVAPMPQLVSSTKTNLLLIDPEMLSSGYSKAKLFAKNVTQNSKLNDWGISLPVFPSRTNIPVVVLKNSSIGI